MFDGSGEPLHEVYRAGLPIWARKNLLKTSEASNGGSVAPNVVVELNASLVLRRFLAGVFSRLNDN